MKLFAAVKTRWIIWVWNHTPTCAEMSRLASQALEHPHPLKTRSQMWLHWLICVWCQRYYKHLKFLHRAAPHVVEQVDGASNQILSPEARERIKQRLKEIHNH